MQSEKNSVIKILKDKISADNKVLQKLLTENMALEQELRITKNRLEKFEAHGENCERLAIKLQTFMADMLPRMEMKEG